MKTNTFKDLIVWQKSRDLAVLIYKITDNYHRFHEKEKKQFLAIAFGSGSELESQIEIAKILFPKNEYARAEELLLETMKMLNVILH